MQITMVRRLAAATFVAAGMIGALVSGTADAAADRRFKGSATGVVTGSPGPGQLVIDYVGNATHLGKYTRREQLTIHPDFTVEGTLAWVAANGDRLDASFTGQFVSGNDVAGTYTITGGTGRFSDATGTASFAANTPDFAHVSVTFDGTIDY